MEKLPLDIHGQILVTLDVEDLIRCKSVSNQNHESVILSFDLSQEEFKEFSGLTSERNIESVIRYFGLSPEDFKDFSGRKLHHNRWLGIYKESLCSVSYAYTGHIFDIWVLKNYNVKQAWERIKYDLIVHARELHPTQESCWHVHIWFSEHDTGAPVFVNSFASILGSVHICLSTEMEDIRAPVFVQSLVSPNGNRRRLKRKGRQ